ncbi:MAG: glutamine--tRNA ligase/YqeY domain fusion protein [Myxococcales bacterium]|nr:glutamine--tRNA ligase/YqeY domain fusion protein [Myxococcales bacterium]
MSESTPSNFIRSIVTEDLRTGRHQQVVTRFPPEPNGYLHIGHAKAFSIGFGLAEEFGGRCHLRMDDTNPEKEETEFVQGIERDIRWLGYDWGEHRYNASDYFDQLYDWACHLIREGLAYVDEESLEQIRERRGTVEEPGTHSPFRDRPVAESLARFEEMRDGLHADGAMVLRAKIDMAHPNMKMRDPVMYRIRNIPHHRTGDRWHIYPMYDWAHGQSDAIEGVTHSTCSLEFDVNRPLYDWYLEHLPVPHVPHQYEFARLNLSYTVMSKRKLRALVEGRHVDGWDDPRMPTLCAMRRRGIPPAAIRRFIEGVGVAKANSVVDPVALENAIRDELNHEAPRMMAVLDPLQVVVENWEGDHDVLDASVWPKDVPKEGTRPVPFSGRVYIDRSDFEVEPPKGFKRLAPGRAVRLRYAYIVTHTGHDVDDDGRVTQVRVRVDRATRGGTSPKGVKVWGTLHWVDAERCVPLEVRLYDRLFSVPSPGSERDFLEDLNPESLTVVQAKGEPALAELAPGGRVQLERVGYFFREPDNADAPLSLNRVVALKDSWTKRTAPAVQKKPAKPAQSQGPQPERELTAEAEALVARGLSPSEATAVSGNPVLQQLFDDALTVHDEPKAVAGWIATEAARLLKEEAELPFGGAAIGKLAALVEAGTITHAIGKKVFQQLATAGGDPAEIVAEQGLEQIADPAALQPLVDEIMGAFPDRVAAYRGGREGLLGFFVGQLMQRTKGKANPQLARELLVAALAA